MDVLPKCCGHTTLPCCRLQIESCGQMLWCITTTSLWSDTTLLCVILLLRSTVAPVVCRCRSRRWLWHDCVYIHTAVSMGTADPDMDASISSGHIHSSMDTNTIITEPSSAPADSRGNSAPQQHANKKQQFLRSRPDRNNAVLNSDHAVSTGTPMALTRADDPAGHPVQARKQMHHSKQDQPVKDCCLYLSSL